jgi:hypothetical protein
LLCSVHAVGNVDGNDLVVDHLVPAANWRRAERRAGRAGRRRPRGLWRRRAWQRRHGRGRHGLWWILAESTGVPVSARAGVPRVHRRTRRPRRGGRPGRRPRRRWRRPRRRGRKWAWRRRWGWCRRMRRRGGWYAGCVQQHECPSDTRNFIEFFFYCLESRIVNHVEQIGSLRHVVEHNLVIPGLRCCAPLQLRAGVTHRRNAHVSIVEFQCVSYCFSNCVRPR